MFWNPWKEAREAQQEVARLRNLIAERDEVEVNLRQELGEVRLRAKLAEAYVAKLIDETKQAHFRNPKTGRIGKKGERFK